MLFSEVSIGGYHPSFYNVTAKHVDAKFDDDIAEQEVMSIPTMMGHLG